MPRAPVLMGSRAATRITRSVCSVDRPKNVAASHRRASVPPLGLPTALAGAHRNGLQARAAIELDNELHRVALCIEDRNRNCDDSGAAFDTLPVATVGGWLGAQGHAKGPSPACRQNRLGTGCLGCRLFALRGGTAKSTVQADTATITGRPNDTQNRTAIHDLTPICAPFSRAGSLRGIYAGTAWATRPGRSGNSGRFSRRSQSQRMLKSQE